MYGRVKCDFVCDIGKFVFLLFFMLSGVYLACVALPWKRELEETSFGSTKALSRVFVLSIERR